MTKSVREKVWLDEAGHWTRVTELPYPENAADIVQSTVRQHICDDDDHITGVLLNLFSGVDDD